jgi:hypothetical protein
MLRGWVPFLVLAALLMEAQQDVPGRQSNSELTIPAELTTTIRADRVHRGDPVEFRTLEPVLISSGLVMPANAKLLGRIIGAAPQQGDKPSWLVLMVERAVWKTQNVPLHAFISAQITISSMSQQGAQTTGAVPTATNPRRGGRESARAAAHAGIDISRSTKLPEDSRTDAQSDFGLKTLPIKDLRIVRDKDGIAYLFSFKSNVKLPSGTLFVLQNQGGLGPGISTVEDHRPTPAAPQD